jgi:hypothetical protein
LLLGQRASNWIDELEIIRVKTTSGFHICFYERSKPLAFRSSNLISLILCVRHSARQQGTPEQRDDGYDSTAAHVSTPSRCPKIVA